MASARRHSARRSPARERHTATSTGTATRTWWRGRTGTRGRNSPRVTSFTRRRRSIPKSYSDYFFALVHDFSGDGWDDVLVVGFPGQTRRGSRIRGSRERLLAAPCGGRRRGQRVTRVRRSHRRRAPELVFSNGGRLGWAGPDPRAPARRGCSNRCRRRKFRALHARAGRGRRGRRRPRDVLEATGWWKQPASAGRDPIWERRTQPFGTAAPRC